MCGLYEMILLCTPMWYAHMWYDICRYLKDHICICAVPIHLHSVRIDTDDVDWDIYRYTFSVIWMSYCMKKEHNSFFPVKLQLRPLSTSLHCPHEEHQWWGDGGYPDYNMISHFVQDKFTRLWRRRGFSPATSDCWVQILWPRRHFLS